MTFWAEELRNDKNIMAGNIAIPSNDERKSMFVMNFSFCLALKNVLLTMVYSRKRRPKYPMKVPAKIPNTI